MVNAVDGNRAPHSGHESEPPRVQLTRADPAALMAEFIELCERTSDSAKASRRVAQQQRQVANEQRFAAMREAANDRFVAGVIQGSAQIGSAVAQGAQAIAASTAANEGAAARSGAPGGDHQAAADKAKAVGVAMDAADKALSGGAKIAAAVYERSAAESDIQAGKQQEAAQSAGERAEDAADEARRAQSRQDRALSHIADIEEARSQAMLAASRA